MTSKSYTNRTTLWDDQNPPEAGVPTTRGAWRAPSAVLSGDRAGRRVVSAIPPVAMEDDEMEERAPVSRGSSRRTVRQTKFAAPRTPWWRPRTAFGRILLGGVSFIVLAAVVAAVIIVRQFLFRDPHFRIVGTSSIQSTGLSEVNRTQILPVFGEDIGRNIFFVPLSSRRKQLETIPWVQQATVMRYLPDHLHVNIIERTPVAFVRQSDRVELTDADGVILDMPPALMAQHHYSFPVVTGINAKDSLSSRRARMAVYQRFIAELDQNNRHLTEQVSEIDLSDPEDLRATLPEQGSDILAHFGEDHFLERLQVYQSHIAEWRQRYPKLIGVDLRYSGEVPLEMASDNGSAAPAKIALLRPVASTATKPNPAAAPSKPAQTAAGGSTSVAPAQKPASSKTSSHQSAEAKKRAAKLKAAKARAAHEKAAHATHHPAPQATQG